jgi:inositol-phosphate phosphatase/L-galactose 1-phosphate phosphatase/histidinol-phosphatase
MTGTFAADRYLATAHALADRAREIALQWFRTPLTVDLKADASPVTEADRRIEAMCREQLAQRHPSHGIVGEEFGSERLDADCVWVIDPIDGSVAFISGSPLWGTLIALLHKGAPVLGLIEAPATGERWSALRGGVALWQSSIAPAQACCTSGCAELDRARLCAPSPDAFAQAQADAFRRLSAQVALRNHGGDCYGYALLACGHLDLVVEAGLEPHDHLPLVPVVEAAGGVITDWSGRPLSLSSAGDVVAAASDALHRKALAVLGSQQA